MPKKTEMWDPFVSPGINCYGDIVCGNKRKNHSGSVRYANTINIRSTILVSSCGLKTKVTIIVAFHFMKR